MNTFHPQYLTDSQGNNISVIIPFAEYEQIIKQLDELDDIRLHVNTHAGKRPSIPLDEFVRQRLAFSKPVAPTHNNESIDLPLL
ncbi:MAG: hypothetical protein ABI113_05420 [Mucilaginibacter sp.]